MDGSLCSASWSWLWWCQKQTHPAWCLCSHQQHVSFQLENWNGVGMYFWSLLLESWLAAPSSYLLPVCVQYEEICAWFGQTGQRETSHTNTSRQHSSTGTTIAKGRRGSGLSEETKRNTSYRHLELQVMKWTWRGPSDSGTTSQPLPLTHRNVRKANARDIMYVYARAFNVYFGERERRVACGFSYGARGLTNGHRWRVATNAAYCLVIVLHMQAAEPDRLPRTPKENNSAYSTCRLVALSKQKEDRKITCPTRKFWIKN